MTHVTIIPILLGCTSVRCKIRPPRHDPRAAVLDRRQHQAIYLLVAALPDIVGRCHKYPANIEKRQINLNQAIAKLGLPGFDWLLQGPDTRFKISAKFWNGCTVGIEMLGRGQYGCTVSMENGNAPTIEASPEIKKLDELSAELFRPPGVLPSRETMLWPDDFKRNVSEGKGNIYWRNSIWWKMQDHPESFDSVRETVRNNFPGIRIAIPRLGDTGNPECVNSFETATCRI